jgi:hypothetical protein
MKYLCLVYIEEKTLDALSKDELGVTVRESLAYDNAALQVASKIPMARLGSIEVRPIMELQP